MNPRHIKIAVSTAICSLLLLFFSLQWTYIHQRPHLIGNLVFADLKKADNKIKEIIIKMPERTITLLPDNNHWLVKEADNYYASFDIIQHFYTNLESSRFIRVQEGEKSSEKEVDLRIIGEDNKELNRMLIYKRIGNEDNWLVRIPSEEKNFIISGHYSFPEDIQSWVQQPLMSMTINELQSLKIDDLKVSRNGAGSSFTSPENKRLINESKLKTIISELGYLYFDDVLSAQNFDDTKYPYHRSFEFADFSGLVYHLNLYTDGYEYWAKLNLLTTSLPTITANDYIKHNAFLFDGWFFKLSTTTGRLLFQYKLQLKN